MSGMGRATSPGTARQPPPAMGSSPSAHQATIPASVSSLPSSIAPGARWERSMTSATATIATVTVAAMTSDLGGLMFASCPCKSQARAYAPSMSIESRVMDVELRFMKLERFTQELSDVVAEQGRAIDALRSETKRLRALVSEGSERDARHTEQPDDKPPHYS